MAALHGEPRCGRPEQEVKVMETQSVRVDGQGCIAGSERRFGGKGLRSDPVDAVVLVIE